jgi:hypothetical protein
MEEKYTSIFKNSGFNPYKWSDLYFGEASSIEEYAFLFGITAMLRPQKILEIGTSTGIGTSAIFLGASMTGQKVTITTIDIKSNKMKEDNILRIKGNLDNIIFLVGRSHDELKRLCEQNKKFDFCIIDGGHDFETVLDDWNLCNQLSDFFLFHDSDSEESVLKVINIIKNDEQFDVLSLSYPPGHQLDDPTREWYKALNSPGYTIVKRYSE